LKIETGQLYIWGAVYSNKAQGNNAITEWKPKKALKEFVLEEIVFGIFHAVAITVDRVVYTWGLNSVYLIGNPKLPLGKVVNVETPYQVSFPEISDFDKFYASGFSNAFTTKTGKLYVWGVWLGNEYPKPYKIKIPKPFITISLGSGFIIAITDDGEIWSIGSNLNGEVIKFFFFFFFDFDFVVLIFF
jgi:alpha-tubulin suppressor-like RCC1 family protein